MTHNRITEMTAERLPQEQAGFVMVPAAAIQAAPPSPMEWLYQQMYERAQRANEQPKPRTCELFGIMN